MHADAIEEQSPCRFLFMVGASMPFSLAKFKRDGKKALGTKKVVSAHAVDNVNHDSRSPPMILQITRGIKLYLLGVLLQGGGWPDSTSTNGLHWYAHTWLISSKIKTTPQMNEICNHFWLCPPINRTTRSFIQDIHHSTYWWFKTLIGFIGRHALHVRVQPWHHSIDWHPEPHRSVVQWVCKFGGTSAWGDGCS